MKIFGLKWIYLYFLISCIGPRVSSNLERQKELIRIVNSNPNNTWVAGLGNNNNNMSIDAKLYSESKYTESRNNKKMNIWHRYFSLFSSVDTPANFDARKKWSSYNGDTRERCPALSRVVNNGKCKCGWAISIASVISDRLCISSNYKIKVPLSAQHLISCCKDCCSGNGGNIEAGWEYVKNKGLVTGGWYKSNIGCQPYVMTPCKKTFECSTINVKIPECWLNTCSASNLNLNRTEPTTKTRIYAYNSFPRKQYTSIMKDIMENGPLQVTMHMYEDFRVYKQGIYTHVTGEFVSDHGVKLIGWGVDDNSKYWLLMNSFGQLWGEDGLFKIAMDGSDNTDFGITIIAPILQRNMAPTSFSCLFLIYVVQIIRDIISRIWIFKMLQ